MKCALTTTAHAPQKSGRPLTQSTRCISASRHTGVLPTSPLHAYGEMAPQVRKYLIACIQKEQPPSVFMRPARLAKQVPAGPTGEGVAHVQEDELGSNGLCGQLARSLAWHAVIDAPRQALRRRRCMCRHSAKLSQRLSSSHGAHLHSHTPRNTCCRYSSDHARRTTSAGADSNTPGKHPTTPLPDARAQCAACRAERRSGVAAVSAAAARRRLAVPACATQACC